MTEPRADLPTGWAWHPIRDVTADVANVDPRRAPDSAFSYVDISSIDNERLVVTEATRLTGREAPSRARRPIQTGDVVFSNVRTYLRNIARIDGLPDPAIASTGFTVLRPGDAITTDYLFHYVASDEFIELITPRQTGTQYPATSDRVVRAQRIPVAPLPEQHRIAARLEEIGARRASIAGRLAAARVIVGRLRAAVLAAACSGRLTADWRYEHGSSASESPDGFPPTWESTRLGDIVRIATGATPLRKNAAYYQGGTIPWVTSGAVNAGIISEPTELITPLALKETNVKLFPPGTLLIAMYGEGQTRGRVAELAIEAGTNQALAAIVFDDESAAFRPYLRLFFETGYQRMRAASLGGVQPNLSLGLFKETVVPLPPLEEQHDIVERATAALATSDRLRAAISTAETALGAASRAAVRRAFRGELAIEPRDPVRAYSEAGGAISQNGNPALRA